MDNEKYEKMLNFIKPHLRDYLLEKGLLECGKKNMRCIHRYNHNVEQRHIDSHGSSHITADGEHVYCEGCHRTSDILDIALLLEPKASERNICSWVTTLIFLYRKYGGK